ncbi:endonuclease/exonuclease/phosphatase family protein [Pseudoalteromonas shioyasakiensis]|uniref:endonuclease/exonuclease/phosphatase family protein n=1 Tax=Pseudoalteromonas shioyasakiensis TaxID=1190813 RepID=UPI002118B940|nr:endonuclease/exonuclease/phosphatase family protein [Pseudoalteromonas shioyasakiensis]MCQ8883183.1 endonuclease/exonuclease/phosphatase family protein [Pseudoalteromonas shioyasakiensis]
MTYGLSSLLAMLLVVSILPFSYSQHYLIRSCDFVRLQVVYLACASLIAAGYLISTTDSWVFIGCAVASIIVLILQVGWIYPYTKLANKEVASSNKSDKHSIRIMSANVLMSNTEYDKLIGIVKTHQPDLLITLESDQTWQNKLSCLEPEYPYRVYCPKDNRYGMHLYSKFKIKRQQVSELIESDIPSIHILFEDADGIEVQGHFIHPAPPSPTEEDSSRPRDTELIILAKALKNRLRPCIVAGDLNDVAWSRSTRLFMRISGLLDPRKGRGFFNTFHASYFFMRWPLDHLFHSNEFSVKRIERLEKYGSDHFALLTELVYNPDSANQKQLEQIDKEEAIDELKMPAASKQQVPMFKE